MKNNLNLYEIATSLSYLKEYYIYNDKRVSRIMMENMRDLCALPHIACVFSPLLLLLYTLNKNIFFYFIQFFFIILLFGCSGFFFSSLNTRCLCVCSVSVVCMDDVGLLTNSVFCAFQSANRIQRVQMITYNLSLVEE